MGVDGEVEADDNNRWAVDEDGVLGVVVAVEVGEAGAVAE